MTHRRVAYLVLIVLRRACVFLFLPVEKYYALSAVYNSSHFFRIIFDKDSTQSNDAHCNLVIGCFLSFDCSWKCFVKCGMVNRRKSTPVPAWRMRIYRKTPLQCLFTYVLPPNLSPGNKEPLFRC